MVVGDAAGKGKVKGKQSLGPEMQASIGAVSGAIARTLVAPLDVVKIRLQVQLEPLHAGGKYTSMFGCLATILKEEGVVVRSSLQHGLSLGLTRHSGGCWGGGGGAQGLWRGTVPAVLFWMPYTAVQFASVERFRQFAAENTVISQWDQSAKAFVGGGLAGVTATLSSYPLDLIRTNLAAQGEPKVYHTMRHAALDIVRKRGVSGLYAGLAPTLLEIVPHSGIQFGSYDACQRLVKWAHEQVTGEACTHVGPGEKFACGLLAGSLAKTAIHPLDVVKKRMQIAGLARSPAYGAGVTPVMYSGVRDAIRKIVQKEGVRGLYKGLSPNILKAAPSSAITLLAYELITARFTQEEEE